MCPPIPTIDDSNILTTGLVKTSLVGQDVTFTCEVGYHLVGDGKTRCLFNGTAAVWSEFDSPTCDGNKHLYDLLTCIQLK